MIKASELFKKGEYNYANFITKGSITTISIYKHGWKRPHKFKVKDFIKGKWDIVEDEDILGEDEL